ncbi:type I polyketide synthase [Streptomyces sp. NBRC 109706]|uniref:type I polyketide synthase n=1 Tax=Streptomyces sp. NBRC 109706 TaxID=1550035 RepID=UPI000D149D45|nr:type I polyketide synthase [Streptomyces sp. NBRC 109706]
MPHRTPVAIVGMSVLFPGAPDLDTYWHNISNGVDSVTEIPPGRWDPEFYAPDAAGRADRVYCRRGGFVDDGAVVDAAALGVMPNSVPATEPDQLIALQVAHRSIEDAGGPDTLPGDRSRVGVVLGRGGYLTPGLARLDQRVRTAGQLIRTLSELIPELSGERLAGIREAFVERLGPERPESAIGLVPNLAASRVANRLDLRGPAYTVDAACASSLIAVDHAVRELDAGACDLMLAGGVHHCHDITLWSVFSQLGALSRSQRIRPFDRAADGVLIGEGTGVVVLKRLADAERDGDRVYAVIRGTGVASDGRSASLLNPDPGGQARAVRLAWQAAGLDPRTPDALGLLEAHGTATPAGDSAELATLAEVFGTGDGRGARAAIGSVKSMIGHTMPAAGIAGLVKAALALHHRTLPPTLHCEEPHPALAATRFRPLAEAAPWDETTTGAPRRAGVNAFGFGGINAHAVLEQAASRPAVAGPAGPRARVVAEPERTLWLAADGPEALGDLLAADDATVLGAGLDQPAAGAGPARVGIVAPDARRLLLARKAVAKGGPWRGRGDVWFAPRPLLGAAGGRTAFVFPGLEAEFQARSEELTDWFGLPATPTDVEVGDVGRHGAAVFQLGRTLDTVLRRLRVVPDAVAGHSLGEWTAMACGGIHTPEEVDAFLASFDPDSLRVPGLVFAALGLSADRVQEELAGRDDIVLSHDNARQQSMVCGPEPAVTELVERLRKQGVIGRLLPFRSGFHTPMLAPYLGPIRRAAERYTLRRPSVPVWSATTAAPFPEEPAAVRELFVRHLLEPVRFRKLATELHRSGVRAFVQVGPGQLGSLIDDTLADEERVVVSAHNAARDCLAQARHVATALWVNGGRPDVTPLTDRATARGAAGASGAPRTTRPAPVRLELGGALVTLDQRARGALADLVGPSGDGALGRLGALRAAHPIAAELSALLTETADSAAALIGARATAAAVAPPRPAPAPPPPRPPSTPPTLRVGLREMPYLADHTFFRQRPGWPDIGDRWPVVPATTVLHHIGLIAEGLAPGRRLTALSQARMTRWIEAEPAREIPVETVRLADDRFEVRLTGHARAQALVGSAYPAPPSVWRFDPAGERTPELTAEQLYTERWMFHGPRFQGVTALTAIGARHVRGIITTPEAPGALLDNAGQILGYWIMATQTERTTVLPVGMAEVSFHGPHPEAGEPVECLVRITDLDDTTLVADVQLVRAGRVWAQVTGWADRRFDTDPGIRAMDRWPGSHTLSTARPEGWTLVHERWRDPATRELLMRNVLGGAERETYRTLPPARTRQWLLGRIAAKDAVRGLLWAEGAGEIYPAEIALDNDPAGRPVVHGVHGRAPGELTVSLAHRAEAGVAIARRGPCGIDIEEIAPRPRSTVETACDPEELALLDELVERHPGEADEWFTRFWAAKEAVAKARGTGLRGRPADFRVVAAEPELLRLTHRATPYAVRVRRVSNPPGLPERHYVVAWTVGADEPAPIEIRSAPQ